MTKLQELFPVEFLEKLQQPENAQVVMECMQRMVTHYNHGLYEDARVFWQQVQAEQIRKGAEKYPEPLNPKSWSAHQLVVHAMQENVDQAHYLTALDKLTKEMECKIEALEDLVNKAAAAFREIDELRLSPSGEQDSILQHVFAVSSKFKYINGGI